jgi:nicotinamide-nucleotide amidase
MHAELLTIGSELISGATVNGNAAELARALAGLGLRVSRQVAVADTRAELLPAVRDALQRAPLVITTGGLGPTFDDITIQTIAEAAERRLRYHADVAASITRFYTRRHRKLQQAALRQAYLPEGASALPNPLGTAPGMWLPLHDAVVVSLPGVPREMRAILQGSVLPRLRRWPGRPAVASRTLRTVGIVELSIEQLLKRLRLPGDIEVGLYPDLRAVDVRLTATGASAAQAARRLARAAARLSRALGETVYGGDGDTLEAVIGGRLRRRRATIAVAESCTGGLVSHRLTNVPGSSAYVRGAVVAYHNDVKRGVLGVPQATRSRGGAVSAQTARAMAEGVRRMAGADVGLSVTGIAGPAGGSTSKPVGLVWIGLADARGSQAQKHQFFGDRRSIKAQAAQTALNWLRLSL